MAGSAPSNITLSMVRKVPGFVTHGRRDIIYTLQTQAVEAMSL